MSKNEIFLKEEKDDMILELQRLVACYQEASRDDRNVVWAVLNKYAPIIDGLVP